MGPPLPVTEAGNEDTTRADIDGPGALPKQVLMQITATSQDEHAVKGKVLLISSSLFHQNSAFMYDEYTRNHIMLYWFVHWPFLLKLFHCISTLDFPRPNVKNQRVTCIVTGILLTTFLPRMLWDLGIVKSTHKTYTFYHSLQIIHTTLKYFPC